MFLAGSLGVWEVEGSDTGCLGLERSIAMTIPSPISTTMAPPQIFHRRLIASTLLPIYCHSNTMRVAAIVADFSTHHYNRPWLPI